MNRLITQFLATGSIALVLGACGGGSGSNEGDGSPTAPEPVAVVEVAPDLLTLSRGETMQLSAIVKGRSGSVLQGRTVTWSSGDAARVVVAASGLVRAIDIGRVDVTAVVDGVRGAAQVVVFDPAAPASRVAMNRTTALLEEGDSLQFEATAYDGGGNVLNGRGQRWTSSDAGVALVSPAGRVTGLRPGEVTITVRIDGAEATSTVRVFADYGFELVYSRAEIVQPERLYTLDISDPAATALPLFGPARHASHAAPSPDGRRVAFVVHGPWDGTYWQSMIYVADRDGSDASRLTFLPARNDQPVWSPDGTRIAFRSQPANEAADIWVVDADGSNLRNLTADQPDAGQNAPAWSPRLADGSDRIAYSLLQGGTSLLWTMRSDGSDKRQLTSDANFHDDEPAWSPDGSTLVFQRTGEAVFGDLYLVPSTGGAARALMPANPLAFGQFAPNWSPDGRLIAFTSKHADGQSYQVWTVWSDGTRLAQRTDGQQQHADPTWITRP